MAIRGGEAQGDDYQESTRHQIYVFNGLCRCGANVSSPDSVVDSDASKIAALREARLAAVKAADADRLAEMVTDDVVVVHGNGRCVCGKEAVKADFLDGFGRFSIDQRVLSSDVVVRNKWAFEIGEVESTLTPMHGVKRIQARSTTVVVMLRQDDASWSVSRVLGLLD